MKVYKNTDWKAIELNEEKKNIPSIWEKDNVKNSIYLKARIGWQGLKNSEFIQEGIFYCVTGQDFSNNEVNWENCYKVTEDRYSQDTKIQLKKDDILITKDGTIGKFAKVKSIPNGYLATLNSGVFVSRAKNIQQDFWFYILKSNLFFDFVEKQKSGSTIAHLNQGKFENLEFLVPSDKEQSAIASILSSQESVISKTKDLIANLDKRNQFMMDELLSGRLRVKEENGQPVFYKNADDNWQTVKINGEDVDIPKDWDVTNLEEEIDWFTTGTAFKTNEMKANGKYPVIKMTDIKDGKIEKDFKVFCDTFKEKSLLKFGDLVVGLSGSVGKVGEVLTQQEILLNQRCLGLRIKKFKTYVRNILEHDFKNWIDSTVKDGVIPNLSHLDVLKYNIPKLSEKEKQMIDKILFNLQLEKQKYEDILKKEEQTFTFLLEELMSGRLRVEV